jgi:hypothetical protein
MKTANQKAPAAQPTSAWQDLEETICEAIAFQHLLITAVEHSDGDESLQGPVGSGLYYLQSGIRDRLLAQHLALGKALPKGGAR